MAAERATEEDIEQLKQLLAKASTHLNKKKLLKS
jgi:DNA-binding FadR family transcriptional regulator